MRITLTVHQFLPHYSAGTEILTLHSAQELARRGHDVEIWTAEPSDEDFDPNAPVSYREVEGLPVHVYRHNRRSPAPDQNVLEFEYQNSQFASIFDAYLRRRPTDLVHFFHLTRLGAGLVDVCRRHHLPTIYSITDFWPICVAGQLRIPSGELCHGPDADGANCVRHLIEVSQRPTIRAGFRLLPDVALRRLVRIVAKRPWLIGRRGRLVRAAAFRPHTLREAMTAIDRLIVPSAFMADMLAGNGISRQRMRVIPFGLQPRAPSRMARTNPGQLRIGFIGTLEEPKGAHVLLAAVKDLPAEVDAEFRIYGDPSQRPAYAEQLRRLAEGDSRIRFSGTFANDRLADVFSQLDALVVPSLWWENNPLVIASAQMCGVPVIGSNVRGISSCVEHNVNGLLFERGDVRDLAAVLLRCVRDRQLLPNLASRARPVKTIEQYVDDLLENYDQLTRRRAAA